MLVPIIINIIAVSIIFFIDLYRHNYKQLTFSSMLIAITVNGLVNLFLVGNYDYISFYTPIMLLVWTVLQLYLDHKHPTRMIKNQKFIAYIITIIVSTSLILTYITSNDSYYMSIPYLSPAIFLIGAILLFYSTFQPQEQEQIKLLSMIKHPITLGHLIIILSLILMTLLTPYWYAFIIVYLLFILYLFWVNVFSIKK